MEKHHQKTELRVRGVMCKKKKGQQIFLFVVIFVLKISFRTQLTLEAYISGTFYFYVLRLGMNLGLDLKKH
jgi:hypothetical protein